MSYTPEEETMTEEFLNSTNSSDWEMWEMMFKKNKDQMSGVAVLNACVIAVIAFIGIVANLVVVFATTFGNNKQKDSSSITYVTNLSISNFVFLTTVPFRLIEDFYLAWMQGEALCQIVTLIKHLNFSVVALFLMVMSIDRHLAVNKPLAAKNLRSSRVSVYASLFVWSVSLAGALPLALMHSAKEGTRCQPNDIEFNLTQFMETINNEVQEPPIPVCSYQRQSTAFAVWTICNFFYSFLIPFLVIICCYCAIVQRVRHPSAIVNAKGKMHRGIKRKVTVMAVILVISYTVCYMPYYVWQMVRLMGVPVSHITVCTHVQRFNNIMAYVNSALHPIVYACTSGQFSLQFRQAKSKLPCIGNAGRYHTSVSHARTAMTSLNGTSSKDAELTKSPGVYQKINGVSASTDEKEKCFPATSVVD